MLGEASPLTTFDTHNQWRVYGAEGGGGAHRTLGNFDMFDNANVRHVHDNPLSKNVFLYFKI